MKSILEFAPGPLRDPQREFLEKVEACYDSADVFVCEGPTGLGKSWIAITLARWLEARGKGTVVGTPYKRLQDQYHDEFPQYPNLRGVSSYNCKELPKKSCEEVGRLLGDSSRPVYCKGCVYVDNRERAKNEKIAFANYHAILAHKLFKENMIYDECHNLTSMIENTFSVTLWQHKEQFPDTLDTLEDAALWLEKRVAEWRQDFHKLTDQEQRKIIQYEAWLRDIKENSKRDYFFDASRQSYGKRQDKDLRLLVRPLSIARQSGVMWPQWAVRKIFLLSATISPHEVKQLGLSGKSIVYHNCKSPIPPTQRPIIFKPYTNMKGSFRNTKEGLPKLAEIIDQLAEKHPERGLVHVTYGVVEKLRPLLKTDPKRLMFYSKNDPDMDSKDRDRAYKAFLNSDPGTILIAGGMAEGIDLKDDRARWQVIGMLIKPYWGEEFVRAKASKFPAWYDRQAAILLMQQAGRVCRSPNDYGVTYIVDRNYRTLDLSRYTEWPMWFSEAIGAKE